MDDFSIKRTKYVWTSGGEANAILPQEDVEFNDSTIVTKDEELFMVVGTPGGSTIITSVLQTILNVIEWNMGMQEAVSAPRFHHQWLPEGVMVEQLGFEAETLDRLKRWDTSSSKEVQSAELTLFSFFLTAISKAEQIIEETIRLKDSNSLYYFGHKGIDLE